MLTYFCPGIRTPWEAPSSLPVVQYITKKTFVTTRKRGGEENLRILSDPHEILTDPDKYRYNYVVN